MARAGPRLLPAMVTCGTCGREVREHDSFATHPGGDMTWTCRGLWHRESEGMPRVA